MKPVIKKNQFIDTQVLIIGAGLVGSTFAAALAHSGVNSVVVDLKKPENDNSPNSDGRASAIALASKRVFDGIGLWPSLSDYAAPILGIRVSEQGSLKYLHFDHQEIGSDPFGFMLENFYIRSAQEKFFRENTFAKLEAPNQVKELVREKKGATAHLTDGKVVRAPLVVAADGRNSQIRSIAGIRLTKWPYNQSAIVCNIEHEKPHDSIAHEHFLPAGPFAILPLLGSSKKPNCQSAIVWIEKPELVSIAMNLPEKDFLFELKKRLGDFLGTIKVISQRWDYPLSLQFAATSVSSRLALIGDSAHGIHPIAGQGLNMGIRDAAALAEVIVDSLRLGKDIGSGEVLSRYQRYRRFDNTLMLVATDRLNSLFSNNIVPIKTIRNFGLAAVNRMPLIKKLFMRYAMGDTLSSPRLMRGFKL